MGEVVLMTDRDLDRAQEAMDRRMPDERCTTCTADACPTCKFNVNDQCYKGMPMTYEVAENEMREIAGGNAFSLDKLVFTTGRALYTVTVIITAEEKPKWGNGDSWEEAIAELKQKISEKGEVKG